MREALVKPFHSSGLHQLASGQVEIREDRTIFKTLHVLVSG